MDCAEAPNLPQEPLADVYKKWSLQKRFTFRISTKAPKFLGKLTSDWRTFLCRTVVIPQPVAVALNLEQPV